MRMVSPSFPRWVAAIGCTGLIAIGAGYVLSREPAPRVRVQWQSDLSSEDRNVLERRHLLINPRDPLPGGSLAYDLLDTRASNIRSLIEEPAVINTGDIDRETYTVPFDTEYGMSWMWCAHRIPGFRYTGVRRTVVVALALMTLTALIPRRGARRQS